MAYVQTDIAGWISRLSSCTMKQTSSLIAILLLASVGFAAAGIRNGLNIGFDIYTNEVVNNGAVQPEFRVGAQTFYTIEKFYAWQEMYITLANGDPVEYSATVTSGNNTSVNVLVDDNTDTGSVSTNRPHVLRVNTICVYDPGAFILLTIKLQGYDDLNIAYYKVCETNLPHAGFSVSTVDYSPTLTPDVALNGLVLSEWLDDSNSRVVPENVNELIFYMWVDMGFQPFTIIRAETDKTMMSMDVLSGYTGLVKKPIVGTGVRAAIHLKFNCLPGAGGKAWAAINLEIEPFDPLPFSWFKMCPNTQTSSGMSGAGVFFLVVFILTTVACIGGCVFKYVKLHARGLEVLPFIDNYRAIYARITNKSDPTPAYQGVVYKSSVGPQAEFDAPTAKDGSNPFNTYQSV